ncbi:MAG: DinB family protein [Candidatus Eisenbacteria bacterium]
MDSRDLLRTNLARSRDLVLMRVEDMRAHALVAPTPRGGGHTLWVLGHLACVEHLVVDALMRGEPNPLAAWERVFDGDDVSTDAATFPGFDEALAACREARAHTLALLETLSEADLDRTSSRVPAGFESTFGTWRDCLQYAADHWLMHRGTLADARRAAGVARMWV